MTGLVMPWLDGHYHSMCKIYRVVRFADALRLFVYRKAMTDAVAGAVIVIKSKVPEWTAGNSIDMVSLSPFRNRSVANATNALNTAVYATA